MPWGRCSPGALQLNGCGDISPAINSGLCSAEPGWICRRESFRGFDLHLCIYSTGGLVLLVRKCLFNSLPYLFKIAHPDSVRKVCSDLKQKHVCVLACADTVCSCCVLLSAAIGSQRRRSPSIVASEIFEPHLGSHILQVRWDSNGFYLKHPDVFGLGLTWD